MRFIENKYRKSISTLETYSLFLNVDETILKLNPLINKYGFEFISINLNEFEKQFSNVFVPTAPFNNTNSAIEENHSGNISHTFLNALTLNHNVIGFKLLLAKRVILLKKTVDLITDSNAELDLQNNNLTVFSNTLEFARNLYYQLRLLKNGDIFIPISFQIDQETRFVGSSQASSYIPDTDNLFQLTDEDIVDFSNSFTLELKINQLSAMSFRMYNLAYEIADPKIKFLTLMISLECLFNVKGGQISHTIARHLSIIISRNKAEFEENYLTIKKLYKKRNDITHGSSSMEDISDFVDELQNMVRSGINYCLKQTITKDEMFDFFNSYGFER